MQRYAVVISLGSRVEAKLVVLVIVLLQVEQDRRCLKDNEVVPLAIDERRDAPVRVQLDEPRLLLHVGADVDLEHAVGPEGRLLSDSGSPNAARVYSLIVRTAVGCLELLEEHGNFVSVRRCASVKQEVLVASGHCACERDWGARGAGEGELRRSNMRW